MQKSARDIDSAAAHAALVIFALLSGMTFALAAADGVIVSDSTRYYDLAAEILRNGSYDFTATRLPAYPAFLVGIIAAGGDMYPLLLVLLQSALHTWASWNISGLFPFFRFRGILFALVLLNPVAIFYCQALLPDILFEVFVAAFLGAAKLGTEQRSKGWFVAAGVAAFLTGMTRGNGQFLVLLLPLVAWLYDSKETGHWVSRHGVNIALGLMTALLLFGGYGLSSTIQTGHFATIEESYKDQIVRHNLRSAYMYAYKLDANKAMHRLDVDLREALGMPDQAEIPASAYAEQAKTLLLRIPPARLLFAVVKAEVVFTVSSGRQSWAQIFYPGGQGDTSQPISAAGKLLNDTLQWYSIIFVAAMRVMLLFFFVRLPRLWREHRRELALCGLFILYGAFFSGFIGYSRYRLPWEVFFLYPAVVAVKAEVHRLGFLKRKADA